MPAVQPPLLGMMGGFPGRGMVPPFPGMMAPGMMGINPGIMPGMMGMNGMPMPMMQQAKGNSWNLDSGDGKSGMAIDANVRVLAARKARGGGTMSVCGRGRRRERLRRSSERVCCAADL